MFYLSIKSKHILQLLNICVWNIREEKKSFVLIKVSSISVFFTFFFLIMKYIQLLFKKIS